MSQLSPSLRLPFIQPAQAQKHVTHNEAVELLDAIVQLTLQDTGVNTPQNATAEGQAWGIGPDPTAEWAGHAGEIATWRGGGWLYLTPQPGWRGWVVALDQLRVWDGAAWEPVADGSGTPDLDNLAGVGINAASDATNRLSVAADATLLNHDGGGHQLKLNKALEADTGSLLFQTGFSGRAEMGLAGSDDFGVKVSADGNSFVEAVRVAAATGEVSFPSGARTVQHVRVDGRYQMDPDTWYGPSNAFGIGTESFNFDMGTGTDPTPSWIQFGTHFAAGDVIRGMAGLIRPNATDVTSVDFRVILARKSDGAATWSSAATTQFAEIGAMTSPGLNDAGWTPVNLDFGEVVVPDDGHLLIAARGSGGYTVTRFLFASLRIAYVAG